MPRKPSLVEPISVRMLFPKELIKAVDQERSRGPEATTRSSFVRSTLWNRLDELTKKRKVENDGGPEA
jgi:hypothetical protein